MKKITYTKKDIVDKIQSEHNLSKEESRIMVELVLGSIKSHLKKTQKAFRIEIRDFGVFEVKPTKAKPKARNPHTNEEIFVPAHKKTHFKPGKIFKNYLNQPI